MRVTRPTELLLYLALAGLAGLTACTPLPPPAPPPAAEAGEPAPAPEAPPPPVALPIRLMGEAIPEVAAGPVAVFPESVDLEAVLGGFVVLMVTIDTSGQVQTVEYIGASDPALVEPTIEAVRSRQYRADQLPETPASTPETRFSFYIREAY